MPWGWCMSFKLLCRQFRNNLNAEFVHTQLTMPGWQISSWYKKKCFFVAVTGLELSGELCRPTLRHSVMLFFAVIKS